MISRFIERYKRQIIGTYLLLTIIQLMGLCLFGRISGVELILGLLMLVVWTAVAYAMTFLVGWFQTIIRSGMPVMGRLFVYCIMCFAVFILLWSALASYFIPISPDEIGWLNGCGLGSFLGSYHIKQKCLPEYGIFFSEEEKQKWIKSTKWQLKTVGILMGIVAALGLLAYVLFHVAV
ncbi:MAG: hypothetical protein ACM3QW_07190 [Ignavibacteriales bacterium]